MWRFGRHGKTVAGLKRSFRLACDRHGYLAFEHIVHLRTGMGVASCDIRVRRDFGNAHDGFTFTGRYINFLDTLAWRLRYRGLGKCGAAKWRGRQWR